MVPWLLEYLQKDRGYVFNFGGKDSSMLGRRGWVDALSKGMVRYWVERNGSILGQRGWFDAWFNSGTKLQMVQYWVEGYG